MRDILTISLPAPLTKEVKKAIQKEHFASMSEFFRHLTREWLAQEEIRRDIRISEREFAAGKGKVLSSLKEVG